MPGSVRPCRNYVELHIILLHFPAFYDTILILRKLTAENNRWNINKIANILPMKTQRIHPHIIGFVEWEWPSKRRKPAWIQGFWPVTLPCDTGLILFVSTRSHKRMIAKGKRTALLNDKFSRAVLLAPLFCYSQSSVFKYAFFTTYVTVIPPVNYISTI